MLLCECACGTRRAVRLTELRRSRSTSCGCLTREGAAKRFGALRRTHGETAGRKPTPEYTAWAQMIRRCENVNFRGFAGYGGRGIRVCQEWRESFSTFLADMGRRPSPSHSLDRIDNGGNYAPSNCRWSTKKEQAVNRSRTHWLEYGGSRLCLKDMAALHGLSSAVLSARIRFGWDLRRALTTPVGRTGRPERKRTKGLRPATKVYAPSVPGRHSASDIRRIYDAQKGRCAYCRCRIRTEYRKDHIVAISDDGTNDARNIQLTCVDCNTRKGAKRPEAFARELGLLI